MDYFLNKVEMSRMSKHIIATIDLGSNSFHMLISEINQKGDIKTLAKVKHKVQLRSGLTVNNDLTNVAKESALKCFHEFSFEIKKYEVDNIKIVGTHTLREAKKNIKDFLEEGSKILGATIEVVSGEEEARLIYMGAANSIPGNKRALIIDIGGGSTELIVGQGDSLSELKSLNMGCVSFQEQFFSDKKLMPENFKKGKDEAKRIISQYLANFDNKFWDVCIGASGTIRSIANIAVSNNWSDGVITRSVLERLEHELLSKADVDQIEFLGLREDRENILAGGFCVLYALFESLKIEEMKLSEGALREGMLSEEISKIKGAL